MNLARLSMVAWIAAVVTACATVRSEDLDAWKGRPVADLDRHPMFNLMKMERRVLADGTEVRTYVNGVQMISCSSGGMVSGGTYNQSGACISRTPACNNIFYIKGGIVQQYTPIGGARCFTDDRARPGFSGSTNF